MIAYIERIRLYFRSTVILYEILKKVMYIVEVKQNGESVICSREIISLDRNFPHTIGTFLDVWGVFLCGASPHTAKKVPLRWENLWGEKISVNKIWRICCFVLTSTIYSNISQETAFLSVIFCILLISHKNPQFVDFPLLLIITYMRSVTLLGFCVANFGWFGIHHSYLEVDLVKLIKIK